MLSILWTRSFSAISSLHSWLFGSSTTHVVHVRTGNRSGAGTDANVKIVLVDDKGIKTETLKLNHWWKNDFERDTVSSFNVGALHNLDVVEEITLTRDGTGFGSAWFVDYVEVEHVQHERKRIVFPIHRWVKENVPYTIRGHDTCLPQKSHEPEERKKEIEEKKQFYEYKINVPNGPAQIKDLPCDEHFPGKILFDLVTKKYLTDIYGRVVGLLNAWKSMEDVKSLHNCPTAKKLFGGEPYSLKDWNSDIWFGKQRIQGCNPILIKHCTEIPEKFGVTEKMLQPFLQGLSLSEALKAKRIFIVDLNILENLPCRNDVTICTPFALFFLNDDKDLVPIAIQLFQERGPDNPVFLPNDPPFTWQLAKMYYNNADAIFHQAYTHLGFTHLIMEGVVICTHRNLSPSHPIFRLLAPHFLYLLAINTRGLEKLVSENGWVDRTMSCGREGMFELIRRGLKIWRLDENGTIPKEIAKRGVLERDILPYYPYRDDAIAIFEIIRTYVTDVLNHFYESSDDITNDHEVQSWRRELVLSREEGGVGLLGVPGDDTNGFTSNDSLIDTVTAIISVCSIGHAAANFQQFDEYAFPPNYPACLIGDVPKDKTPLSEEILLKYLPNKRITLDIMVITKMLSERGTKSLGDFEVQYLYDPASLQAGEKFRQSLKELSDFIKERNKNNPDFAYKWLDPEIVPNSISI